MKKQAIIFNAAGIIVFFAFSSSAGAANINVTYNINTNSTQTPISKYIYGTNFYMNTDYTIQRIGGNRCTAYNWENNWSNAGSDYLFENDTMWDSSNPPVPGLGYTNLIDQSNSINQDSIVTLQLAGYVSAPIFGQNLDQYPAPSQYFYPVQFAKGAPFCSPPDNPNTSDNIVYMDEFVNFLVWKYGYAGTATGVKFYSLDNEVDIWDSTHKEVHPADPCAAEIRDKSIACAKAVKNVDPNAQIMGPVLCVFTGFLNFCDAPDWSSVKGSRPWFISYYLDEMKKASDANGRRLLDVLDIHWYPPESDGNGHGICDNREDPQTFNARMQAPRTLWDTGYVLPDNNTYPDGGVSWVNQWYWAQFLPILTRFKADIATYFPDTNIAITEYTWGPSTQWATGITTADFLGICGKYGVYMANYWGSGGYIDTAIKMYTNYDGCHSTFGDMNVSASISDKVNSSIYASVFASSACELHLIVINKNQTNDITGTFNITSPQNFLAGRVWKFDNTSSAISETTPISTITNNTFTYTIPMKSVCHIVLLVTPLNVSITSPLDGDKFKSGDDIVIEANASAVNGSVTKVGFFRGSTKLGEDTDSPYSYTWNDVNAGRYRLITRATNNNGGTTASAVNISVFSGNATGFILREWWTGISGTSVSSLTSDINYPANPNGRALLTSLEAPTDWASDYGTRIRGYLYPPADGNYTFWIASDDNGQLWLSTDDDPCHAVQIAYVNDWTSSREWTKYTSQTSTPKSLLAGHKYYIEVLQKEGGGGDNIAVAWQGPGITQQVIDGFYLSPWLYNFKDYSIFAPQWLKTNCSRSNAWCNGADRDRDGSVQIDDLMAFAEWWLYDSE